MTIARITENKKQFIYLLLLADEQEDMVDRYLERGDMFALYDKDVKTICVVTKEAEGIYEIKNIATYEEFQGKGYGKKMIEYVFDFYKGKCETMYVGTVDTPQTIGFYQRCGFKLSHRIKDFYTDNYDHPIFEDGKQLTDMICLIKNFEL